jgi:hypothetical protein
MSCRGLGRRLRVCGSKRARTAYVVVESICRSNPRPLLPPFDAAAGRMQGACKQGPQAGDVVGWRVGWANLHMHMQCRLGDSGSPKKALSNRLLLLGWLGWTRDMQPLKLARDSRSSVQFPVSSFQFPARPHMYITMYICTYLHANRPNRPCPSDTLPLSWRPSLTTQPRATQPRARTQPCS